MHSPTNRSTTALTVFSAILLAHAGSPANGEPPRPADGPGSIALAGEFKQWHNVSLTLQGPFAREDDPQINPFLDYRFEVDFVHESGVPNYRVPGYFAADGKAAHSGAAAGTCWRAHLSPDKPGNWTYRIRFHEGKAVAVGGGGRPLKKFDGLHGDFTIAASDKSGRDFRGRGRLRYVGKHHLQFAGTKEYFLKAGPDSPETLLAYADFDNTRAGNPDKAPLKHWKPHLGDWKPGDPVWGNGRGKGLIGALNYLANKGLNGFSFLPYNAGGDGDNVWPFVNRDDKLRYDCSKLDQWGIVFEHATNQGLHLHFKLQETEMDDERVGHDRTPGRVPTALDGGKLGPERKLYCRELVARFSHALALNWNLGEENTQSTGELTAMSHYLRELDPYDHPIVVHTFPDRQDQVYEPLLGSQSILTGVSLQNSWDSVHQRTLHWVNRSAAAGRPWVVANDEQGNATAGVPPDLGYQGYAGRDKRGAALPSRREIRQFTLWANLMAGGAGVEYYFGYQLPQNDLLCEDWRSRERVWDDCRTALEFFHGQKIPFWEMRAMNRLIENPDNDNSKYCLAKPGELYLVYLPQGGTSALDLRETSGPFRIQWFNPRNGKLSTGTVTRVRAGGPVALGQPPSEPGADWLIMVRR